MTGCENIQCILSVRLSAPQIVSSLYSNPLCQTLSKAFEMSKKSRLRDFEILGWCPVGPVLPHQEKVPL